MTDKTVQMNNWNAAMVATQEAYLGEVLGKFLEADAKLRLAQAHNKQLSDALASHEALQDQYDEAKEALKAANSNRKAFEEQNNSLSDEKRGLMDEVNALRRQLQDVKLERQRAMESELAAKEELAALKAKPSRQRRTSKSDVVDGKHDKAQEK